MGSWEMSLSLTREVLMPHVSKAVSPRKEYPHHERKLPSKWYVVSAFSGLTLLLFVLASVFVPTFGEGVYALAGMLGFSYFVVGISVMAGFVGFCLLYIALFGMMEFIYERYRIRVTLFGIAALAIFIGWVIDWYYTNWYSDF